MVELVPLASLFPEGARNSGKTGLLPYQAISAMLREREIVATRDIRPDQIQPASLDLRLGDVAFRVRASFLPGRNSTVRARIEQLDAYPIDLTASAGAVLERGCVYVIPLLESLNLKNSITGLANPKSSTGRLDVLTRLITDQSTSFDQVGRGYKGPLYVEVAPRTFSIVVRSGSRLNQIRFRRGSPNIAGSELTRLYESGELLSEPSENPNVREKLIGVSIDLKGTGRDALVGWRAVQHTDRIDIDKVNAYDPLDFWEPIYNHRDDSIILNPDDFYILATKEAVRVPPDLAAEMLAYDTGVGEFRVHYAGFFDPGFGWGPGSGESKAVLEVRSHEVPFMLEHGQTIGWLRYEQMAGRPDRIYGGGIKSNYQGQGLALAKQFRPIK
ncbi:MAG: 2'-deoxycytidine 5'-triphosphate deaminase [Methylomonas sp.]|nr:2'-deoxycytidine 5'-triphosphate deaminase [Methylomonas sp.]